ncbi:MAG: DUF2399 domain-containing protein [Propionibacterium sp.]|nr:DUF2399 domain-containing protein [Propionibacterium sp.]
MSDVPSFILEWARRPGPRTVLTEARKRLESGGLGQRAQLNCALSDAERAEVGKLMPAAWQHSSKPVSVRELRRQLESHAVQLEELLIELDGPLRDRRAEAREARTLAEAERREALDELAALLDLPVPERMREDVYLSLDRWVLRRVPPRARASAVAKVVGELPQVEELLAAFAARVFGDAHALDQSRPLGRAVARFLAVRTAVSAAVAVDDGQGSPLSAFTDPVMSPDAWRQAWAAGNVACDAVSSTVLVLNLPIVGNAPAVAQCAAAPGEPTWLTLRSLRGSLALGGPMDVFVCENPSIVEAAAAAHGAAGAPLVCTFGRPTAAVWQLLRAIAAEARFHVRADGDSTGWSIVAALTRAFPAARPWRMPLGTTTYEEELIGELIADLARSAG